MYNKPSDAPDTFIHAMSEAEEAGLDDTDHGESGYHYDEAAG